MKSRGAKDGANAPAVDGVDADQRLAILRELLPPMAIALGPASELILHDYRHTDHSVVAVAGSVTKRKVGSAMSEIGLSVLADGNDAQHRLNYLTTTRNGNFIKSSTIVLRDKNQRVFGALCINTDVTALQQAGAVLASLIGDPVEPQAATFADDIRVVIDKVLAEQLKGRAAESLSREDRLAVFEALDQRGVFSIKRGLTRVAERLGISRATGYAYLQAVKDQAADTPS